MRYGDHGITEFYVFMILYFLIDYVFLTNFKILVLWGCRSSDFIFFFSWAQSAYTCVIVIAALRNLLHFQISTLRSCCIRRYLCCCCFHGREGLIYELYWPQKYQISCIFETYTKRLTAFSDFLFLWLSWAENVHTCIISDRDIAEFHTLLRWYTKKLLYSVLFF